MSFVLAWFVNVFRMTYLVVLANDLENWDMSKKYLERVSSGYAKIAIENDNRQWVFPLKMVAYGGCLPEGTVYRWKEPVFLSLSLDSAAVQCLWISSVPFKKREKYIEHVKQQKHGQLSPFYIMVSAFLKNWTQLFQMCVFSSSQRFLFDGAFKAIALLSSADALQLNLEIISPLAPSVSSFDKGRIRGMTILYD